MDWLKAVAPTVATALAGPLGGLAVQAIGAAFGWEESTRDKVTEALSSGNLTPEQIVALKQVEADLIKHERDHGFKFAELEFRDRDSARQREASVKDPTNRTLAFLIVGAFIAVVGGTLLGYAEVDSALAGTLVGYISAKAEQVLAYYFGSSSGSLAKTQLLAKAPAVKE
jgi:hypothetical protein